MTLSLRNVTTVGFVLAATVLLSDCFETSTPVTSTAADEGRCIWYGICHEDERHLKQNCPYNGTAKQMNDSDALAVLHRLCPDLMQGSDQPALCCDPDQVHTLDGNLAAPQQIFSRCPACFHNFAQLWCQLTCSPVQSQFAAVSHTAHDDTTDQTYITGVDYYVSHRFVQTMYNSCRNVQFPGSNQKAIGMVCGTDADKCTPSRWLEYMGNADSSDFVPFNIVFHVTDEDASFQPQNAVAYPCSVTSGNGTLQCSCQDCVESCKDVDPYEPPYTARKCFVGKLECLPFISLLSFGGFAALMFFFIAFNSTSLRRPKLAAEKNKHMASYTVNGSHSTATSGNGGRGCELVGTFLDSKLEYVFGAWGRICTRHPVIVLMAGILVSVVCSLGLLYMQVTTDPVQIWSISDSQARKEKDFFDQHFGPFYRTEQLIIVPNNRTPFNHTDPATAEITTWGPVFRKEFLHEVFRLQSLIQGLLVDVSGEMVSLSDICLQPLSPDTRKCMIQSALNYFQNNDTLIDLVTFDEYGFEASDWLTHMKTCIEAPTQVQDMSPAHLSCLGEFGGPVFPYVALGGLKDDNFLLANALVITFVVNNFNDRSLVAKAEAWEKTFIELVRNYRSPNMTVMFSAERSVQDEISRESHSDIGTILISYAVMFVYIAFALGQYSVYENNLLHLFVNSKVVLGLVGVIIVILSVTSSVGIFAFFNVPATLISVEVVPFLVLAVGVDNIFILVQAYQRDLSPKDESLEYRIGRISAEVIPTMLLSSLSECFCFFLGALSSMPAVKIFSLYAATALCFDFFLQITCFLAVFTLDIRRQESGRLEVCCCVRLPVQKDCADGILQMIMRECYAPLLLWKPMRFIILIIFVGWFCSSLSVLDKLDLGLDQALSMPSDSYVLRYFNALSTYLAVGPPVYFVVKGKLDYSNLTIQNSICGSSGCSQNSLCEELFRASLYKDKSYIAYPASSWIDDYFDWLKPIGSPPCCRHYANGTFCPATAVNAKCKPCPVNFVVGRPDAVSFDRYLTDFLIDNPSVACSKGGHATYLKGLYFDADGRLASSYFMTYHKVLRTSRDYINALSNARAIAANITANLNVSGVEVFPYSVFYVFYEQYLTLVRDALVQVVISICSIFVVTLFLLGMDFWSAIAVVITITMIVCNVMGLMYWWGISLNAVSLVNLVMAVGISVEFCSHITRAFAVSVKHDRLDRAFEALSKMGSSVLSGITLTKFGGIVVLAFSHSQIFQVFYFRMYLGIVLYGAAHGLVFLPVFLSFFGPPLNKQRVSQWHRSQLLNEGCREQSHDSFFRNASDQDLASPIIHTASNLA